MADHAEKCADAQSDALNNARAQFNLTRSSLGAISVALDSTLVIIGFFTSMVSSRVNALVPENRTKHVAILSLCITVLLFLIINIVIEWTALLLWRLSNDFAFVVFRVIQFFRSLALVLSSNFLTTILFAELNGSLSWLEAASVILCSVFSLYLVLQLFHIRNAT
jgi:hypothetical protein